MNSSGSKPMTQKNLFSFFGKPVSSSPTTLGTSSSMTTESHPVLSSPIQEKMNSAKTGSDDIDYSSLLLISQRKMG
jgi:hypothetical protein